MIYTVKKDEQEFEVDDNVFFEKQSKAFRDVFESTRQGDIAEFDNCYATLLMNNRIIITIKEEEEVEDGELV